MLDRIAIIFYEICNVCFVCYATSLIIGKFTYCMIKGRDSPPFCYFDASEYVSVLETITKYTPFLLHFQVQR